MLDLSRLVPEAQPIVERAAMVYIKHTEPWFIGLVAHGSALKGGVIPGCSDIDFQLYLKREAFTANNRLPIRLGITIHRDLAEINPSPFGYIQCYPLSSTLPEGWSGPIPGAYHLVAGRLPVPEATAQELRNLTRERLDRLTATLGYVGGNLLEHGAGRLEKVVRYLCTDVWSTLYGVLTIQIGDPIGVWNLTKYQAMDMLPSGSTLDHAIREFYSAIRAYYPAQASTERALVVIECGAAFLEIVGVWWGKAKLNKIAYNSHQSNSAEATI